MTRVLGVLAAILTLAGPPRAAAQKFPAGAVETQLALDRLTVRGSTLMIAAHPDDENTALLAWLAQGRNVRTGYLSLTRGEGGQNLIGSEQGDLLGVIRTHELLAARRIDGAEQFFTSATDFGYSKSADEALNKWGREKILGDIVYIIRKFRPDVIVLRFSGTPRDGHGQHQASAILGKDAFSAAADPNRFPEQLKELKTWQAKRLLWNAFAFTRQQEEEAAKLPNRIELDLGEYDPLLGYSYSEIAGISRSQHRSQGMGSAERRGTFKNYLVHVAGDPATKDIFDGVETDAGDPLLAEAARTFEAREPEKTISLLLKARPRSATKTDIDEAIALCAGLFLDVSADRAWAATGSDVKFSAQAINRSRAPIQLQSVRIGTLPVVAVNDSLRYNQPVVRSIEWKAQRLVEPLKAVFTLGLEGQTISLERPVWNRYVDTVRGELTRPFVVVPPVSVRIAEPVVVFPTIKPRTVAVQVRSYGPDRKGTVRLSLPPGWKAEPASVPFYLQADAQQASVEFSVTPPSDASSAEVTAVASMDGEEYREQVLVIDYPHIPQQTLSPAAAAKFVRVPVEVSATKIGYVMGAGDRVADLLSQIGVEVTLLGQEDLARGDLSRFDAIVTGVRAYNTRADLRANQHRLMEYVRNGGTVVVQYNVLERGFTAGDPRSVDRIGPYPLKTGTDRVSVEEAPVEFLKQDHPLFTTPNRITAADWSGWIQERGLYFASEWDPRYEPLIATHDPGEPPRRGGLLYARHGSGTYVFTAFSWFRQLPAGVPGAWRIFANLLSAGKAQ